MEPVYTLKTVYIGNIVQHRIINLADNKRTVYISDSLKKATRRLTKLNFRLLVERMRAKNWITIKRQIAKNDPWVTDIQLHISTKVSENGF